MCCTAGLSEDSDYTSDVSYPNQQNQYASFHQANSSSSQFESVARHMKPMPPSSTEQCNQYPANTNTNLHQPNEAHRPKRELPFGGSTDLRNIFLENQFQKNNLNGSNKLTCVSHEEAEPLYYNSRPRRALPQINFNKERFSIIVIVYQN